MKRLFLHIATLLFVGLLQTSSATTFGLNVSSSPLWTDTHALLSPGDTVSITASGSWSALYYDYLCGPDGMSLGSGWQDGFLSGANTGALIAYVGTDPFQGHWGDSAFFPQASGYWLIGSRGQFTSPVAGELWLGFNDDAVSQLYGDNIGFVSAQVSVVPEPSTWAMAGLGVLTLLLSRRSRGRR